MNSYFLLSNNTKYLVPSQMSINPYTSSNQICKGLALIKFLYEMLQTKIFSNYFSSIKMFKFDYVIETITHTALIKTCVKYRNLLEYVLPENVFCWNSFCCFYKFISWKTESSITLANYLKLTGIKPTSIKLMDVKFDYK